MNKRQWIVGGVGALIALVMFTLPSLRQPLGMPSLLWHQIIGGIVVIVVPILVCAYRGLRPPMLPDEGYEAPRRSLAMVASGGCLILMLIPVALLVLTLLFSYDVEFDSSSWLRDSGRTRMANDLTENHLRKGMTRPDVEKMLGPPDAGSHLKGGAWFVYTGFLGPDILHVEYEDGRVTGSRVVNHGL